MSVESQIRQFIATTFFFGDSASLGGDHSLLESGAVDSTGVMELVLYLEETFGLEVLDEDLVPENLDSVDRLTEYVRRKRGVAEAGS